MLPVLALYCLFGFIPLSDNYCSLWISLYFTISTCSLLHYSYISYDRYLSVLKPIKYSSTNRHSITYLILILLYLISAIYWIPLIMYLRNKNKSQSNIFSLALLLNNQTLLNETNILSSCRFELIPWIIIPHSVVSYLLPMFLIFIFYSKTIKILNSKIRRRSSYSCQPRGNDNDFSEEIGSRFLSFFKPKNKPALTDLENLKINLNTSQKLEISEQDRTNYNEISGLNFKEITPHKNIEESKNEFLSDKNRLAHSLSDIETFRIIEIKPNNLVTKSKSLSDVHFNNNNNNNDDNMIQTEKISTFKPAKSLIKKIKKIRFVRINSQNNKIKLPSPIVTRRQSDSNLYDFILNQTRRKSVTVTQREKNITYKLGGIMILVLISWVPISILWPISSICLYCIPNNVYLFSLWLTYANSLLSPLILILSNSKYINIFYIFKKKNFTN